MSAFILLYIVVAVPFAFLTAFKARKMRQSFWAWLGVGLCLPVISLAVVQWFESDWSKR